MAGTGKLDDGGGHAADGTGAGNEYVFSQGLKAQGCVGSVAKGIKDGIEFFGNVGIARPDVDLRNHQIFSKGAVAVNADPLDPMAVFLMSFQTVAALAAGDVSFSADQVSDLETADTGTDLYDLTYVFMAGRHTDGNGILSPLIPLVDMHICPADGRFVDLDLDVSIADLGHRHSFHPNAWFRLFLDESPHHVFIFFFHVKTILRLSD